MPKLLDFIKEKGFSHEQVISILEGVEPEPIEDSEEVEEESEPEVSQDEPQIDEDTPNEESIEVEKPELIQMTKIELTELINKAIEEKFKANRKPPSKGKESNHSAPDKNIIKKNWFEVMV